MSSALKPQVRVNVVEMDYETLHRQKRIAEMQRMDIAVGLMWIAICLFGTIAVVALGERVFDYFHQVGGLLR